MKITIIGAGIGGLTTAIALKQKGHTVEIFEASPEFKKAGSGINLAINAMQIYKRLGVYDDIIKAGNYANVMVVADSNLKIISKIELKEAENKYGVKTVAIHRAALHEILLAHLKGTTIHLNKKLKSLTQVNEQVNLVFDDGTMHTAALIIGADGIHSVVRKSIFNDTTLRIAKQICWRGITKIEIPEKYKTELRELWGRGKRFGFVHITEEEVYWYALANYKEDFKKEFENVVLEKLFKDFDPMVGRIIQATDKRDIITNEMMDLDPLSTWYYNNVCLVGDAAHATTPNMGQGACQAIESAYVLAQCLSNNEVIKKAFGNFEKIRKRKAVDVVKNSWQVGKIAHWENNLAVRLRNSAMRLMPKRLLQKQSTAIFKLEY